MIAAGGRAGRRRRLPDRAGHGRGRRARAGADRATRWTALAEIPGVRDHRPARPGRPRRRGLVRRRRRPPARRRPGARRPRHRRPGRAPLRLAAAPRASASRPPTRAIFYVYTTHGRDRRAGRRGARGPAFFGVGELSECVMQLEQMYQEIILDHYQNPHPRACGSRSTPRCTTSTRPAATRSRCGCSLGRRHGRRRLLRGAGLLDQPGVGLGAERPGRSASRWPRR